MVGGGPERFGEGEKEDGLGEEGGGTSEGEV